MLYRSATGTGTVGGMSNCSCAAEAAEGADRPQQLLDAVREQGPTGLAEELGDQRYLLTALLTEPDDLFDQNGHASSEYEQLMARVHELRCALDALEAHTVVALTRTIRREDVAAARDHAAQEAAAVPAQEKIDQRADRRTRREVSMTTRRSPHSSGTMLRASQRLVDSMPRMLGALTTGTIPAQIAQAVGSAVGPLQPAERREVDRILAERLPDLDGAGSRRWKREVDAIIAALDPEGEYERHQRARRDRHVALRPGEHGMSTISVHLPAREAATVFKRLSIEAERRRADGSREGHSAIMTDALVSTLLGRSEAMDPVTLDIGVMITDRALLTPDHADVAHIEGYGPVPAEAVRAELRDALREPADAEQDVYGPDGPTIRAVMRRIYTHPVTGELVAVESRAREYPPQMGLLLRWRDTTCRGPHCNAAIRQHDHIRPHAAGGPTSIGNGQGGCGICNQKEEDCQCVEVVDGPGHRVAWTSRGGTTRTTTADRLTPPGPHPPPGRRRTDQRDTARGPGREPDDADVGPKDRADIDSEDEADGQAA